MKHYQLGSLLEYAKTVSATVPHTRMAGVYTEKAKNLKPQVRISFTKTYHNQLFVMGEYTPYLA